MLTSSILETETADIAATVSQELGMTPTAIESIGQGRNSQVYRVMCDGAYRYVVKRYFNPPLDARGRMGVEFSSLAFLWDHGVRNGPQPIVSDPEYRWAVYAYVNGQHVQGHDVTESDLDDAVRFLALLKSLRQEEKSARLPIASEACFSLGAILDNIHLRLERLTGQRSEGTAYQALTAFLHNEFLPARDRIAQWCSSDLTGWGDGPTRILPQEHRTLSPSDFGFHNALKRSDGDFVYLDFEYFGWDDPAKILADFVMHPAMDLSQSQGRRFAARLFQLFGEDHYLPKRAETVYPLFGLKWCLILLNEFVPRDLLRRDFAGAATREITEHQLAQLEKSRRLLHRILSEYEQFPYGS